MDLSSGKAFHDRHRSTTLGAAPKRARFLGRGCFWFGLRWNCVECLEAKWQQSGAAPVGEEAEVADAHKAFGEQVQQEATQELIER